MRLSKYQVYQANEDAFWFVSTGPKGKIIKAVLFEELDAPNRFNLGMGDWNRETDTIEDLELSGNGDARKIFATIAEIVRIYTNDNPEREIFLTGNTDDKKHTYSIMTSAFLEEITVGFNLWGAIGEDFEPFEKGKVYAAILLKRK